jgi:murein DD-endopeptidase MepM/ murein hydrolase activator NlpD
MKREIITHKDYNNSDKVYLLNESKKHHIQDLDTFQLGQKLGLWGDWGDVKNVPIDNNVQEGIPFLIRSSFQFQANPLDKMFCTQKFGERPDFYKQWQMIGHNGVDFRTKFDDTPDGKRPVYAVLDGIVQEVANIVGQSGYGKYIKIIHDGGSETLYAHLDIIKALKGQSIKAGDSIAISDATGVGTAAHLHFGFRPVKTKIDRENGYMGYIDPLNFFLGEIKS